MQKVVAELEENAGTQFDPEVVVLFLNEFLYDEEKETT